MNRIFGWLLGAAAVAASLVAGQTSVGAAGRPFLTRLHSVVTVASTVPSNGDVNPYGTATVPASTGDLVAGDTMVSNFNNSANLQGTGTTLVQIAPDGTSSLFAQIDPSTLPGACPGGVGLTTALVVLESGWVVVGSLPTSDGTSSTAQAGCLLVLDSSGTVQETFSGAPLSGPWDMTALDSGTSADLFVTNVLNGTVAGNGNVVDGGTIVRIGLDLSGATPTMTSETVIGSGFPERTDPAALVIGPTGVGLANGTLYVADSVSNRIAAIPDAATAGSSDGIGSTVSQNGALDDPLGLTIAPNGDVLTANGNDGRIVETTPAGAEVAVKFVDRTRSVGSRPGAGTLFGLAMSPDGSAVEFVDDGSNTLSLVH